MKRTKNSDTACSQGTIACTGGAVPLRLRITPFAASLAVLALPCALQGASFVFDLTTSGTFAGDGAFPVTLVHVDHPSVDNGSLPFSFSSLVADQVVDLSSTPPSLTAVFTFTGTGGDTLSGTWAGVAVPGTNPDELLTSGSFMFTGGTGLFEGANGGGEVPAVVQFTGPANGVSSIEWSGTLSLVPEPKHYALAVGGALGLFGLWRQHCRRAGASTRSRP